MSFARRKKNKIEPVSLATLTPAETEAKIIAGVKRFAINADVWSTADANTPFLGQTIGMGIESANLVDITMTMEKLFLVETSDGESQSLVIRDGEDTFAATPGLAGRMLMDAGHMTRDDDYLNGVISFANIVVLGEGYRLNQQLCRSHQLWAKEDSPTTKSQMKDNIQDLLAQVDQFITISMDPERLASSRKSRLAEEQKIQDALQSESQELHNQLAKAEAEDDASTATEVRGKIGPLKVRLNKSEMTLRVSKRVAEETGRRRPVEDHAFETLQAVMVKSLREVSSEFG